MGIEQEEELRFGFEIIQGNDKKSIPQTLLRNAAEVGLGGSSSDVQSTVH